MAYQDITLSISDGIAIVTLARPARLNAYTPDMGEELVAAFRQLFLKDSVRAIVLTGAGRGFCAGADRDFATGKQGRSGFRLGEEPFIRGFVEELVRAGKPLIAAINGPASGIGVTMTLPFDRRIASESASFDFPFVRLGLMPAMGATYFLPRLVGPTKARELIFSGKAIDAHQALAVGLVDEIASSEDLLPKALLLAASMSQGHLEITAACKRAFMAGEAAIFSETVRQELEEVRLLAERKAGMR